MSVTFTTAAYIETTEYGTILAHGADHIHTCPVPTTCEDHLTYGVCDHREDAIATCGCQDHDVNISNANAYSILERLGYDADDLTGHAVPADLLGRAMVANIGRDDSGVATTTDIGGNGATIIDCGVRPGYYDATMARLVDLATYAADHGLMVGWA